MIRSSNNLAHTRTNNLASFESLEKRALLSASYTTLADINPGSASSLPEQFQTLNSKVLFLAYDSTHGQMLWSTDGTAAGTTMIADINPNPRSGTFEGYGQDSIVIGNEMYFAGTDYAHGTELWKTDGTSAGTQLVGDLNPGLDSSSFTGFTNLNGKLAFEADNQLWISDGTPGGTHSLGNLNPTGVGGTSDRMAVLGSELYFFRYDTPNGSGHNTGELWETNGTVAGTQMVIDISPGSDGRDDINATASDLITIGNTLYFAADDGTHGWELYRSDGTAEGTTMVDDLAPSPTISGSPADGSYPANLTDVNGTLYFTASANYGTPLLYKLNSSGQPQLVSTTAQSPQELTAAGSELYFTASDATHGSELWKSDGTSAGTLLVSDINAGTGDSNIADITVVGSNVFFSADDGTNGPEIWMSDGTAASGASGTLLYASSNQAPAGSSPADLTALNGKLILEASVGSDGEEPQEVDLPPTSVSGSSPVTAIPVARVTVSLVSASKSKIDVQFSGDVSASFGRASFSLINIATGLRVDPANIRVSYNKKTNVAQITFHNKNGNVLMTGHYRLRIVASKVVEPNGNTPAADALFSITIAGKKKL